MQYVLKFAAPITKCFRRPCYNITTLLNTLYFSGTGTVAHSCFHAIQSESVDLGVDGFLRPE